MPTLIVGKELLTLGGVALAVGGWFRAHRHSRLQGFVEPGAGKAAVALGDLQIAQQTFLGELGR